MSERQAPSARRRLAVVRKALHVPKLWLPGKVQQRIEEERVYALKNRAERRRRWHVARRDGSPLTKPSLKCRGAVRHRRSRAARKARRENRI